MRIQANRSLIEALVLTQVRSADGLGAQLHLRVLRCEPKPPARDFIGAKAGDEIDAFTPVPEAQRPGQTLLFEAELMGGPWGERVVLRAVIAPS